MIDSSDDGSADAGASSASMTTAHLGIVGAGGCNSAAGFTAPPGMSSNRKQTKNTLSIRAAPGKHFDCQTAGAYKRTCNESRFDGPVARSRLLPKQPKPRLRPSAPEPQPRAYYQQPSSLQLNILVLCHYILNLAVSLNYKSNVLAVGVLIVTNNPTNYLGSILGPRILGNSQTLKENPTSGEDGESSPGNCPAVVG